MHPRNRFSPLRPLLGLLFAAGGCTTSDDPAQTRKPRMPTMGPAPSSPAAQASAREFFARVSAQATTDPAAAAATLAAIADPAERTRIAREIATTLAQEDPARAATFASAFPPGLAQGAAMEVAAGALTRRDPDAALRWAIALSPASSPTSARQAVAAQLVQSDARAALARLTALPAGPERDELLGHAIAAWARQDTDAAVAWARDQTDAATRERLLSSAGFAVAQSHPDRATAIAELLPTGRNRWLLTGALAQTWVAKDPKAAFTWAGNLPAGEARDAAYAGLDTGLGSSARRGVSAPNTRSGSSRTRGGVAAAQTWREQESAAFAEWLKTQRDGITRDEAILEYVRQRGASEPQAVGQLLSSMPGSATRDQAVALHVEGLLQANSPRDAANLLRTLPRSDRSDEMTERVARQYLLINPAVADAWLDETSLSPFRKQELRREAGLK
ncbi:MAG: hypothetical protein V4773_05730 [Verrucomicrobiota bacterium]